MIEIREYQPGDLAEVTALMTDLGYPTSVNQMAERMALIQANSSYETFIALKDGYVAGVAGCRENYYYEADGMAVQITLLVVKRGLQGQGIGKALMTYVEDRAKGRGASLLHLTSGNKPEREAAHAFYQRIGFKINGHRFVKNL